jgi:hypothetical protein
MLKTACFGSRLKTNIITKQPALTKLKQKYMEREEHIRNWFVANFLIHNQA